ncbi:MAG: hypothetical protein HQ581_16295 [Planctomycetes bacterium]|nr:hypothetical protein [Planctomycetota bacterium]
MSEANMDTTVAPLPGSRRRRVANLAVWLSVCLVHGAAVAWLAVSVQHFAAPLVLFPILLGFVLGATGVGLLRVCRTGSRAAALAGVIIAAIVAVAGQHYLCYREVRAAAAERDTSLRESIGFRGLAELIQGDLRQAPDGLLDYMRQQADEGRPLWGTYTATGIAAWASWIVDGLLLLTGALAVVIPALRQPYCRRCGSWFRTVRRGHAAPATASRVAQLLELAMPASAASARYRMVWCDGGCGPCGFEFRWEHGGDESPAQAWLDPQKRAEVLAILDASPEPTPEQ